MKNHFPISQKLFVFLFFLLTVTLGETSRLFAKETAAEGPNRAVTPENRDIDRFREQSARMALGDVDLLMVGDSITHGWEGAGKEVWEKYYGNRKVMNFGIGGDRTGHVLWRIENSPMEKISPKMAVVLIGTNNVGHESSDPAQTVEGIGRIVDKLKTLYPSMKILLMEVFPRDANPDGRLRQAVNEINAGLESAYADGKTENVRLLNIASLFLTDDGILPAERMPDFLHPSAAGYELWAAAMEPYIVEALDETPEAVIGQDRPEDWWQNRYHEKVAMIEEGDFDLLMIGDSITHRWETVGAEEWARYFGDKKAINLGIDGDKTMQVIWRLEHYALEKIHPKGAVLLIGVNNMSLGQRPQDTALGIRKIVTILKEKFPEIRIVVLKVFPWGRAEDRASTQVRVDALNAVIEPMLLGFDRLEIIDIGEKFLDARGHLSETVAPDFIHPSPFGYEIWGNALDDVLKDIL